MKVRVTFEVSDELVAHYISHNPAYYCEPRRIKKAVKDSIKRQVLRYGIPMPQNPEEDDE